MTVLGDRLKKAREIKGFNQLEASKRTKINNKTLSRYENGGSEPDVESLKTLADIYDVSIDYLVGRTDDPNMKSVEKIQRIIDLSDDNIINADMVFDNKSLDEQTKRKVIRILREVVRIEVLE